MNTPEVMRVRFLFVIVLSLTLFKFPAEILCLLCNAPLRDRKIIVIARELIENGAYLHTSTSIQSHNQNQLVIILLTWPS